jgi:hypothetical protein
MMHRVDAESFESFDATHDIEDGVHRTDFMQVHLLRRDSVDATLSLAYQSECADRALFHPVRNRSPLDELHQLAHVSAVRLRRNLELHLLARDTSSTHVSNRNTDVAKPQPCR